jgi:hypothetical protein
MKGMRPLIDLTGQQFGRLTVLERAPSGAGGKARWRVRCDCSEERTVWGQALRTGRTRSCGCLRVEVATAALHADPRCGALIDLSGQRFGRLTVLERAPNNGRIVCWRVRCECGEGRVVRGASLRSGRSRSCGCLNVELSAARLRADPRWGPTAAVTHGLTHTPEYHALKAARLRCTNPRNRAFADYGGRRIEYRLPPPGEAAALLIDAIGRRPEGMTLDRIDNDGHYEAGNLRWATRSEQRRNQRPQRAAGG